MKIEINAAVVDVEETREIAAMRDPETGTFTELVPVVGSECAFLHLRLPGGHVIRAEVPSRDFEAHVAPLLVDKAP